jgi:hypothetical protein
MGKHNKARKNRANRSADEKAEASLRKRKLVWWTHFGFKGQFFRFSLGTSDRSRAKRQAKKLIALAEAGKISAVAQTPAERSARRSASLKRSHADPKVSVVTRRANKRRWKNTSKEELKAHGAAIRAGTTPEIRLERAETTEDLWKDPDYRKRNVRSQKRRWSKRTPSGRRNRKAQSRALTVARAKPEVKKNHEKGKLTAARNLLRRRGVLAKPRKRGRKPMPTKDKEYFKHGLAIEMSIPPALREDENAIEKARTAYSIKTGLPRKLCAQYHRHFKADIKANPSLAIELGLVPGGASSSR